MAKTKIKKGDKYPHAKCIIPFFTTDYFDTVAPEDEEYERTHTNITVKINRQGGTEKENYIKVKVPVIETFEDNIEVVLSAFMAIDDTIMPKLASNIKGEDLKIKLNHLEAICRTAIARETLAKAEKNARGQILLQHYNLDKDKALQGSETKLSQVPWRLTQKLVKEYQNDKMKFEKFMDKTGVTDREMNYFGHTVVEEYETAKWQTFENVMMNELNKTIFGDEAFTAFEIQKEYLTYSIVKPFTCSVNQSFCCLKLLMRFLTYFPPVSTRDVVPSDQQWKEHRARNHSGHILRKMKYNLLPKEFRDKLDDKESDWREMDEAKFIDLVKRIEKRDIHDREIQDQAREKLKKRKAKDDAESGDNHGNNASRSDKNKNGKGRKSCRNNEDSPSNAGRAKFCQLCKLAGAPEFVYKTHNAKDCRKKEKYERLLSGGVASRSNATKEYKKELRALNKKYKKAKKEAREYRAMKKQSSNGKRKRKYDSSDDESDDDTSVSSSDTNVSY